MKSVLCVSTASVRLEGQDDAIFFDMRDGFLALDLHQTKQLILQTPSVLFSLTDFRYGAYSGRTCSRNSSSYFHPISVSSRACDNSQSFRLWQPRLCRVAIEFRDYHPMAQSTYQTSGVGFLDLYHRLRALPAEVF